MNVADLIGAGPKREARQGPRGWTITVTPPEWAVTHQPNSSQVFLNNDQYYRYEEWLAGKMMIQEALPELSDSDREILLSGLDNETFQSIAGDEDDD